MTKRILLGVVFFSIFGVLAIGTTAYAIEHEEVNPPAGGVEDGAQTIAEPISAEEQAALQAIAMQLVDIETEVNRLSLVVSKYVLEQQALALEQQVLRLAAITAQPVEVEKIVEGVVAPEETVTEAEITSEDIFGNITIEPTAEEELEDLPIPIVATDEGNGGQGFLAGIQSAVGELGTPEFITVFILAVLAIFVIARRTAQRRKKKDSSPKPVSSPDQSAAKPEGQQQALDKQKKELQERVAWK